MYANSNCLNSVYEPPKNLNHYALIVNFISLKVWYMAILGNYYWHALGLWDIMSKEFGIRNSIYENKYSQAHLL